VARATTLALVGRSPPPFVQIALPRLSEEECDVVDRVAAALFDPMNEEEGTLAEETYDWLVNQAVHGNRRAVAVLNRINGV
jgi:hypothetical protein